MAKPDLDELLVRCDREKAEAETCTREKRAWLGAMRANDWAVERNLILKEHHFDPATYGWWRRWECAAGHCVRGFNSHDAGLPHGRHTLGSQSVRSVLDEVPAADASLVASGSRKLGSRTGQQAGLFECEK